MIITLWRNWKKNRYCFLFYELMKNEKNNRLLIHMYIYIYIHGIKTFFFCMNRIKKMFYIFHRPNTLVVKCGRVFEVVLNFCLERLHHVVISHGYARSNRWCQWHELFRTYIPVNFCNRVSGLEEYYSIDMGPS